MTKTYETYKDSGSICVGQIPNDWNLGSFRYFGKFTKGRLPVTTNVESKGWPIIGASEMLGKECRTFTEDEDVPFCRHDDILILWDGANAGIISSHHIGVVSSTAVKYTCLNSDINKNYLFHYLKAIEPFFKDKVNGTTIPHMNMKYINEIPLIIPSSNEQERIASFLDKKCSEIDTLISLQEEMISELQAYKQSVITEAVIKGLNPNVPMKDSGVEWIGNVPEHWQIDRTKVFVDSLYKGSGITKEEVYPDGDIECVRYGEIYSKYNYSFNKCASLTKKDVLTSHRYFKNGDILCAGTGELVEEIGKAIAYTGKNKCLAGGDIIVISHHQNPQYLSYALNSHYAQAQKSCNKAKLKVVHISASDIANVILAMPPEKEQKQIASYLDEKNTQINSLINIKQEKIQELKDYKKSIIYEYVTGKKRV